MRNGGGGIPMLRVVCPTLVREGWFGPVIRLRLMAMPRVEIPRVGEAAGR